MHLRVHFSWGVFSSLLGDSVPRYPPKLNLGSYWSCPALLLHYEGMTEPEEGGPSRVDEIHQVRGEMVHLGVQPVQGSGEWLCLIEGAGVCLGNSFGQRATAETWMRNMFSRIFPEHHCDLGCISLPGARFCAGDDVLESLAGFDSSLARRPQTPTSEV